MEVLRLIGVLIVIVGFALKVDTIATVVIAGIVTGLVAGMTVEEILTTLGNAFITNRTATLFVLTLPVIGLLERYGLKDKAVDFIQKFKAATTGRILSLYQGIRALAAAFSLRIGGHPQFIRPLVHPMADAAARSRYGDLDEKTNDAIKGQSAASENYGNFFAQNVFMGASGTLLIVTTLNEQGYIDVTAQNIALWSIPIAIISVLVGTLFNIFFDQRLKKRYRNRSTAGVGTPEHSDPKGDES